jgi:truncated hemoglobin YjbI
LIPDRADSNVQGVDLAAEIVVSEEELRALVRGFYAQAFADPMIGPIFKQAISDWEHHFEVVANFWSRTLLGTTRYKGNPFAPHVFLDLKPEFFDRWITIFKPNAEKFLQPAAAHRAIAKVEHMSVCFQAGLFPPDLPPHVAAIAHPAGSQTTPAESETR